MIENINELQQKVVCLTPCPLHLPKSFSDFHTSTKNHPRFPVKKEINAISHSLPKAAHTPHPIRLTNSLIWAIDARFTKKTYQSYGMVMVSDDLVWWKMEVGASGVVNGDNFRAFGWFVFVWNELVHGGGEQIDCWLVLVVHRWWVVVSGCDVAWSFNWNRFGSRWCSEGE